MNTSIYQALFTTASALKVDYARIPRRESHASLLAAVGYGAAALPDGVLHLTVPLGRLEDEQRAELWWAQGPVERAQQGDIRYASDGMHLFGIIELEEARLGGIEATAAHAYAQIRELCRQSAFSHVLRMWNYIDHINLGGGDLERYRLFCTGRAKGYGPVTEGGYPAASAIGVRSGRRQLQIYWIASQDLGTTVENPRQISAYKYPRQYGATPPSFSRALVAATGELFVSGTASIVGHASLHGGDLQAQIEETLRNIEFVLARAAETQRYLPRRLGRQSLLKIYVREPEYAEVVMQHIRERYGPQVQMLTLVGDICRRELLLEIECIQGGR